ncbi:membrane protein [Amylibacter ulvae]|uniref:Membrane protein n=1 Tax=Paramylibacter ulvae TaxID=1651968 RepID=A0ABQ3D3N1_9RHOB|nr:DUF898 family protein [Amylibacter ulvae]GHA56894.1 membrane protein [Amylibacter ulvae]
MALTDVNETEIGNSVGVSYLMEKRQLRSLAIKTTLLTLLTFGIYRFWARTRLRNYFWSCVAPDGHPFEYDGKGLEKFLGFLIAVAVLAVYLGILQLLLTFAGMSLFTAVDDTADELQQLAVTYIAFGALLPLIFYAQYRARRYKLSRTRWRGIRFGMDKGAWGYALRGIGFTIVTILTVGILWPLQTFRLEKYKADRTWYGDVKFEQNGKWTMLYPAMKHILLGLLIVIAGGVFAAGGEWARVSDDSFTGGSGTGFGAFVVFVGAFWIYAGFAYYRVHSFRKLTAHKTLGETVTFTSMPRTRSLIGIFIGGGFVAGIVAAVLGFAIGGVLTYLVVKMLGIQELAIFTSGIGFLIYFLALSVLSLLMITEPMIRHFAHNTTIQNAAALVQVKQRDGDDFAEAEGFADALDLGAGF